MLLSDLLLKLKYVLDNHGDMGVVTALGEDNDSEEEALLVSDFDIFVNNSEEDLFLLIVPSEEEDDPEMNMVTE